MSAGLSEYVIVPSGNQWKIIRYWGGRKGEKLGGLYLTFAEAERALIQQLRAKDKFSRAIYPNSPYVLKGITGAQGNNE